MEFDIYINADGSIQAVYSDDLQPLFEGDEVVISRASHVEPCGRGWVADLAPVHGPLLTDHGEPFRTRADALQAEMEWLHEALEAGPIRVRES